MGDKGGKVVFLLEPEKGREVVFVNIFGFSAARIAGKEGKGISAEGKCLLAHGKKAAGGGEVAADVQFIHKHLPFQGIFNKFTIYIIAYFCPDGKTGECRFAAKSQLPALMVPGRRCFWGRAAVKGGRT